MRLELENVGKINAANIKLDGITVIAGENNTGKSTIGKMLFCVFSAFHRIEEQIKEERIKSISRALSSYYHEAANRLTRRFNTMDLAEFFVEQKESFLGDIRLIEKEIEEYFINRDKNFDQYIEQEALEKLAERIYIFLNLEDGEIQKMILQKRLEAEFAMKVGHLNNVGEKTAVKLNIKEDCIEFIVIKNEDIIIENYMNLNKDIIYIDDPFVLDDLGDFRWQIWANEFEHRHDLLMKLARDRKTDGFFCD